MNIYENYLKYREQYMYIYIFSSDGRVNFDSIKGHLNNNDLSNNVDRIYHANHILTGDYLLKYLNKVRRGLISKNEFSWFDNKRAISFVTNSLVSLYEEKNELYKTSLIKHGYYKANIFWDIGGHIRFDSLVYLIDTLTVEIGYDKTLESLKNIKSKWARIESKYKLPFKVENSSFCDWLINRFIENGMYRNSDVNIVNQSNRLICFYSLLDYWMANSTNEAVELFILKTKKAWSQKKFRDKVKDKVVLNTYLSKEAKNELKKMAKENNRNINEELEFLILKNKKREGIIFS